eukprot:755324-Hanusia_phi.AAC.4
MGRGEEESVQMRVESSSLTCSQISGADRSIKFVLIGLSGSRIGQVFQGGGKRVREIYGHFLNSCASMRNGECRAGMLLLLAWTDLLFSLQQPVSSDAGCLVLRGGFKRGWKGHDPITKTLIRPKVSRTKRMQKELAEIEYYHEYVHKSREAERLRGQVMEMSDQLFELKEGRTGGHGNLTYNQSAEARSLYLSTLQSLVGQGSSPQGGIQASALNRRQDELLAEPTIQRKRVYKEKVSSSKKKRLAYPSQNSSRRMDADGRLIAKDSVWAKIVSRLKDKIARLCGSSFPTQHASHQTTVVCISDERLKEITSQAAAGSLDAQVELGEMYVNGSLPSDPMKAVACFMKGVDERHPPAMFNMAKVNKTRGEERRGEEKRREEKGEETRRDEMIGDDRRGEERRGDETRRDETR